MLIEKQPLWNIFCNGCFLFLPSVPKIYVGIFFIGGPGGTASQVAGTGQHPGRIAGIGPIRKIGQENRISKSAFFISKAGKIVRSQLADIQRKMYKIVPAERQKRSNKTITKNRCKPSKNGLQRSFLAPPAGFEPVACRLGGDRSIQLSYGGICLDPTRRFPGGQDAHAYSILPAFQCPVNPKERRRKKPGTAVETAAPGRGAFAGYSITRTRMTLGRCLTSSITSSATLEPRSTMV